MANHLPAPDSLQQTGNLELLARQVVEGFITGLHKSPFHGFSVEFAEHRLYNTGDSVKNVDWKLFARTDKLFVKRFEEETNLRCHLVIDASSSMYFPEKGFNKIAFSASAAACLIYLLRKPLSWVFIAGFLAIALTGPVNFLSRWMPRSAPAYERSTSS